MTERLAEILISSFPRLVLYCFKATIPLTVCIYALSLVLAFALALIQVQNVRILKQLARVYVWVFRGTPLIVQMYIIFFGLPSLGITLDAFPSAVIAFSLNYAAYMSETIRAAIQSVPEGQWEAGYSQLNAAGLIAAEAAYRDGGVWYDAGKAYLKDNIAYMREFVATRLPELRMIEPEGTCLVWVDFRGLALDAAALEELILNKAKLWLDSGAIFGEVGQGFQRFNIACPRATLTKALSQLEGAVEACRKGNL